MAQRVQVDKNSWMKTSCIPGHPRSSDETDVDDATLRIPKRNKSKSSY